MIDCSGRCEVLHIYFLMNRLSGPRITKFGFLNECFSDYGISVNITRALKRITFAASSKGGGGGTSPRNIQQRRYMEECGFNLHI